MGRLSIPISDHREIRRDVNGRFGVRGEVRRIAHTIKAVAEQIAGDEGSPSGVGNDGYSIEEHTGTDRVRVNIYANNDTTERAEAQQAPLLQAAMQVK